MFRTAPRVFLLAALCLAVLGCAKPTVTVDALSAPSADSSAAPGGPYVILPGMPDIRPDDLNFVEYKKTLSRVLRGLGYLTTENEAQASAAVLLSYRSAEVVRYAEPSGPRVGIGVGSGGYYDRDWGNRWGGGSFFGLGLGFPVGDAQVVSRWRHTVVLDAVALTPGRTAGDSSGNAKSLWKTTLTYDSDANNLRLLMPAMLNAARPYIGKDTHGPVTAPIEVEP